jgi:predicted Zn-dependent protease
VNRDSYLQRLDGLVFGLNPRDGYFKGVEFFHPELRFRFTFPDGWKTSNERQAVAALSPGEDALVELALANVASADAAARAFLGQQGFSGGYPTRASVGGLPAVTAGFAAVTENGTLRGTVVCVEHRNAVYRLVGYGVEARWPGYQATVERALQSFPPLTDPATLTVQPQRLDIVKLDHPTTVAELARQRPSPVAPATLGLLNQVEPETPLEAGRVVKWVVGAPLP